MREKSVLLYSILEHGCICWNDREDAIGNSTCSRDCKDPCPYNSEGHSPFYSTSILGCSYTRDSSSDSMSSTDGYSKIWGGKKTNGTRSFCCKSINWSEFYNSWSHGFHYSPSSTQCSCSDSCICSDNYPNWWFSTRSESNRKKKTHDDTHCFLCIISTMSYWIECRREELK